MKVLFYILYFILMFVLLLGGLLACKKYIFPKIKMNKYVALLICAVIIIIQFTVKPYSYIPNEKVAMVANTLITIIAVLFFAWFLEINSGVSYKKQEKKIVMKPKAKPNRVKNKNK